MLARTRRSMNEGKDGFTLIELLVVIVIHRHPRGHRHPGPPQPAQERRGRFDQERPSPGREGDGNCARGRSGLPDRGSHQKSAG